MRIVNGNVFVDGEFKHVDLSIEGERFSGVSPFGSIGECAPLDKQVVEADGCYVVPGLIDLHFHGCMGSDMCDGTTDAISALAKFEAAHGVTSICPATMTYPEHILEPVMDAARAFAPADDEAELVGINLEGPFISPNKVGAQNPEYVQRCDADMIRRLQERSGGKVSLVDIAPEEDGALDFVREMHDEVRISIAHTCADYETSLQAFDFGAKHVTHLCNAMPGLHHRDPGPIGAAFDSPGATVELIADGKHVSPAMIRAVFKLFGPERVILISDSMRAAGLADGEYDLGGQKVSVHDDLAWLTPDTIAGSVTDVCTCMARCANDFGIPLADAVRAATETPARALGVFGERGSIAVGKIADAVVLNRDLTVRDVILRGKLLSR
jgi:N-acetylglucosamine-6-phosphate deacetylase